jgi:hypothetical protein
LHKELVNTTDSQKPKVKDEDNVEDDVGDLLVKEEHAYGVKIPSTVGLLVFSNFTKLPMNTEQTKLCIEQASPIKNHKTSTISAQL